MPDQVGHEEMHDACGAEGMVQSEWAETAMRGGFAQGAVPRQRQDGVCSTTLWLGPQVTAIKGGVRTPSDRVRGRFQPLSGGPPFWPVARMYLTLSE